MLKARKLHNPGQTSINPSKGFMHRHARILLASLVVAAPSMPVQAQRQTPPSVAAKAKAYDYRVVVAEVRRLIRERYVLLERRPELDAVLAEGEANGGAVQAMTVEYSGGPVQPRVKRMGAR